MFGFSHIARYTRQWREGRQRVAMENMIFRLPVELQKDIGWPTLRDRPSPAEISGETHARPML